MIQIKPIPYGGNQAVKLFIRTITSGIVAPTCFVYYELKSESGENLSTGNIDLTQEEFDTWGADMEYVANLISAKLNLEIL
jgi:hypothetical protein